MSGEEADTTKELSETKAEVPLLARWQNALRDLHKVSGGKVLTPAERAILLTAASRADTYTGENIRPGVTRLASESGTTTALVRSTLKKACEWGLLVKVREYDVKKSKAAEYRLGDPKHWKSLAQHVLRPVPHGAARDSQQKKLARSEIPSIASGPTPPVDTPPTPEMASGDTPPVASRPTPRADSGSTPPIASGEPTTQATSHPSSQSPSQTTSHPTTHLGFDDEDEICYDEMMDVKPSEPIAWEEWMLTLARGNYRPSAIHDVYECSPEEWRTFETDEAIARLRS